MRVGSLGPPFTFPCSQWIASRSYAMQGYLVSSGYRQARFETLEPHRDIAQQLDRVRTATRAGFKNSGRRDRAVRLAIGRCAHGRARRAANPERQAAAGRRRE